MKDFEIMFGQYKGKKVSEIVNEEKYFYWLFHKFAERRDMDEHTFCMERLWTESGRESEKLRRRKNFFPSRKIEKAKIQPRKFMHHGSEGTRFLFQEEVTQEMEDLEDDWVAENHELIMELRGDNE